MTLDELDLTWSFACVIAIHEDVSVNLACSSPLVQLVKVPEQVSPLSSGAVVFYLFHLRVHRQGTTMVKAHHQLVDNGQSILCWQWGAHIPPMAYSLPNSRCTPGEHLPHTDVVENGCSAETPVFIDHDPKILIRNRGMYHEPNGAQVPNGVNSSHY